MAALQSITPELLKELLEYDADTGAFSWRHRSLAFFKDGKQSQRQNWLAWNGKHAGRAAFTAKTCGYPSGRVLGRMVYAHRAAWAMHYGEWPNGQIDHINGDKSDNRISNLRDVSQSQNLQNTKKRGPHKFKGVIKTPHGWIAQIGIEGKSTHLGSFRCETAAAVAYDLASIKHHGQYGRRNGPHA